MKSLALILENTNTVLENALASCGPIPETVNGKIDYMAKIMDYLDQQSMRLKKDAESIARQKKEHDNLYEKLKEYVEKEMYDESIVEMLGSEFKFKLGQSQGSLNIIDEKLIPDELKETKIVIKPDNARIKAMLTLGHDVPGCQLVQGFKLTIRNTKED